MLLGLNRDAPEEELLAEFEKSGRLLRPSMLDAFALRSARLFAARRRYARLLVRLFAGSIAQALEFAAKEGEVRVLDGLIEMLFGGPHQYVNAFETLRWALMDAINSKHLPCVERFLAVPGMFNAAALSPWAVGKLIALLLPEEGPITPSIQALTLTLRFSDVSTQSLSRVVPVYPLSGEAVSPFALLSREPDQRQTSKDERMSLIREDAWRRRSHLVIDRALWMREETQEEEEAFESASEEEEEVSGEGESHDWLSA